MCMCSTTGRSGSDGSVHGCWHGATPQRCTRRSRETDVARAARTGEGRLPTTCRGAEDAGLQARLDDDNDQDGDKSHDDSQRGSQAGGGCRERAGKQEEEEEEEEQAGEEHEEDEGQGR
ncbi:uncharacterized protein PV09_00559 [Verruconis gallopava]|uniref:Uncharacterized protein n=1 Tax=Verruconis gallopava TaxID=253628 RepID=A0A0D2BBC8_9PEZI|nr:uncharacterized protein PV09_00559 [Verruconis gallopava]KIW08599.1 hypothetical protein PV09_00559 [Verruconis gallopava]